MSGRSEQSATSSILRVRLAVEELERREVPAALTPAQVRHAYGFDLINFSYQGQTVPGDGGGQTIAIVNAYSHAKVYADADNFSKGFSINGVSQTLYQQYGPASSWLTVARPQGTPPGDPTGGLWNLETSLDVQWAHAIAPGAKVLLVEARSNSFSDLTGAVNYARSQPGVVVVSMSWGAGEFSSELSYESTFTTPAGHLGGSNGKGGARLAGGVSFVAASGDSGTPGLWPAASGRVLAVGGTTLKVDSIGNYQSEVAWSGSGGSVSKYVPEPAYQSSLPYSKRAIPDVAYHADPANGFYVYHTLPVNGRTATWWGVGGTSAGSPQWAALIAIVNQGRALQGLGSLDGPTQLLPAIYQLPSTDFHDVKTGSNGLPAGAGYDLATGRGSPYADRIVRDLVKAAGLQTAATPDVPAAGRAARPLLRAQRQTVLPGAMPNLDFEAVVAWGEADGAGMLQGLHTEGGTGPWFVSARPAVKQVSRWAAPWFSQDWPENCRDVKWLARGAARSALDELFAADGLLDELAH